MGALDGIIGKLFSTLSPHTRTLGFEVVAMKDGVATAKVPYGAHLVGDPLSGVLHGGVVTSLLDTTGGVAVVSALGFPTTIATLDLRIDYLRPSTPGEILFARVECYKKTRNVAFTRGTAYNADPNDPVAAMAATYMLRTQAFRKGGG
ncbi:MAG TPA: PaaI family thioesterase [Polyangiales bacterium]|jgi:uncharacterized protein (TIGR00369 family)|nr:PaaI family thioesterase [Polyangiales bacterium]